MKRRSLLALTAAGMSSGCLRMTQQQAGTETAETVSPADTETTPNAGDDAPSYKEVRWQLSADAPLTGPVFGNGSVFVGSLDKTVYAVDMSTGEKLWEIGPGSFDSTGYTIGTPIVVGDAVYTHTDVDLLKIDQRTGDVDTKVTDYPYPNLTTITEELIIAFNRDSQLSAYSSVGGASVWESRVERGYGHTFRPVLGDETVIFATVSDYVDAPTAERDKDTRVFGLDRSTGGELWSFTPEQFVGRSAGVGLATHDGVVVVAGNEGTVFGLSADDGELLWEQSISRHGSGSSAPQPMVLNETFVLASGDVVGLDPSSGQVEWSAEVDAGHISTACPIQGGDIWVPSGGFSEYSVITRLNDSGDVTEMYVPPVGFEAIPAVTGEQMCISHTDDTLRAYDAADIAQ